MTRLPIRCALLVLSAFAAGGAQATDRAAAARGMGHANFVCESNRCGNAVATQAVTLQNDISEHCKFSYDDLLGKTAIGAEVRKGRASAQHDAAHPEYKGQFCESMDEVLSLWRSSVLPSPK